jgi:ribosomal protein L20A (L18A)
MKQSLKNFEPMRLKTFTLDYRIPSEFNKLRHSVEAYDREGAIMQARTEITDKYEVSVKEITILQVNQIN